LLRRVGNRGGCRRVEQRRRAQGSEGCHADDVPQGSSQHVVLRLNARPKPRATLARATLAHAWLVVAGTVVRSSSLVLSPNCERSSTPSLWRTLSMTLAIGVPS